jgi:hypothetical protein
MKALYKNPFVLIFIILGITVFIYFEEQLQSIDLSHLTPGNVVAVLGYLSVIMFVVEQFIEIFVDDPDRKEKKQCKDRIIAINKYLKDQNISIDPAIIKKQEVDDHKDLILKEKSELEEVLLTYELKRQRRTMLIGFMLGLLLSVSGVRIMSGIILNGSEQTLSEIQVTIIQSIDIILTAGIITGGSDRIHGLIKRIKDTFSIYKNSFHQYTSIL